MRDALFFLAFNANKRSLTLNLKHAGRPRRSFRSLPERPRDVLLENFGPRRHRAASASAYSAVARDQSAGWSMASIKGLRLLRALPRLQELRADRAGRWAEP